MRKLSKTEICLSRPRSKVEQTYSHKMVGLFLVIYTIVISIVQSKKTSRQQIQETCVILLADFSLTIPMFTSSVRCCEVVNHGTLMGPTSPIPRFPQQTRP